jgi:penicillin-binding protein 1A
MDPCSFFMNEKRVYEEFDGWSPGNSNGNYEGFYSMKGGLMNSMNTITAAVVAETGPAGVIELAHDMGVKSDLPEVGSIALGTADVSLLEMVSAYTGFATGGRPAEPYFITRIEDSDGNVLYSAQAEHQTSAVFSTETGHIMNNMLQAVVDSGTASTARSIYGLQSELAGKTGTTQNNADGWFIGYSPGLVVGVWVGAESPSVHFRTTALGSGTHMALPIFARTVKKVEANTGLSGKYLLPFEPIPDSLAMKLDCPAYMPEIPTKYMSRKEAREARKELRKKEDEEEKPGFFKRIGNFFKRKKK